MTSRTLVRTALAALLLAAPLMAQASPNHHSRLERERLAVGRALIEVQSTNWTQILPYYTADIEYQDPVVTIEGIDTMTEFLGRMFANSPDLVTTVEDEICADGV
jgi:hypothetical protein